MRPSERASAGRRVGVAVGAICLAVSACGSSATVTASPSPTTPLTAAIDTTIDQMLTQVIDHQVGFAILTIDDGRNYYVQVSSASDGLVAEAVSNLYLDPAAALSADQAASLQRLGWVLSQSPTGSGQGAPPSGPSATGDLSGNWWRQWAWPARPLDLVQPVRAFLLQTLPIYGWTPGSPVSIRTGN
jgi:T3SS (YopN, CesT) and YbjN peptide-binding chaperone 3